MPRMLTSAAVIMALGVGMPALAADETPKPEAGAEAGAQQQQAEQAPAQLEDEVGMKEEKAEGTPMMEEGAEASGEPSAMPETAEQGEAGMDAEQQAETGGDSGAMTDSEQAAETGATEGEAGMAGDEPATAETDTGATEEPATDTAASDMVGSGGESEQVDWAQYVGSPLMSAEGEELGEISTVVAGPDGQTMVIIERGGILGLGRKQYAMMPQDLRVEGDQVIAPMTEDQIAEMPEYEEPEPTE